MNAEMNTVTELSLLGVDASYDNGEIEIEGSKVLLDDARKRLDVERAKPRPRFSNLGEAKESMVDWIDGFLGAITGPVSNCERDSWPSKAEAARAVIGGIARPDQQKMISAEAGQRGKTSAEMAEKIVQKAEPYEAIISNTAGLRGDIDAQLEAATDPLQYEAILEDGKARAIAIAQELNVTIPGPT